MYKSIAAPGTMHLCSNSMHFKTGSDYMPDVINAVSQVHIGLAFTTVRSKWHSKQFNSISLEIVVENT